MRGTTAQLLLIGFEIVPRLEGKYCLVSALGDVKAFYFEILMET